MCNVPVRPLRWLAAVAAGLVPATGWAEVSIPEPDTVFYGRVINRSAGHEQFLTGGTLTWTVTDGTVTTTLTASIERSAGQGIYRLEVPHSLAVSGLELTTGLLPLGTLPVSCRHVSVMVDGTPAAILSLRQADFHRGRTFSAARRSASISKSPGHLPTPTRTACRTGGRCSMEWIRMSAMPDLIPTVMG